MDGLDGLILWMDGLDVLLFLDGWTGCFIIFGCVEPITVEKSHICGNYQYFVKLIRRLGTEHGNM